ncbi:outer membrane beta-barrel protein [Flavobacterium selenitireducens]|uniref:outer membrane beta-barrel protein n=1 Tax=Flavobacterium selenitireducens TaxID=2722704 RepID=UPI00168AC9E8|nr:outer membrane beta-barrel protein [Flavobacterium selenitireducens]MBD3581633.1 porin family protein [Flavobacterium selenitireducens]
MSERKNIDRLFQEKFKDFEAEPSEIAWEKIEARLEEKKNRKVIPIWFRYTGVAAVFLIGLLLTTLTGENGKLENGNAVVETPGKSADGDKPKGNGDFDNTEFSPSGGIQSTDSGTAATSLEDKTGSRQNGSGKTDNSIERVNATGSNASGIRRSDDGIVVYPTTEKAKSEEKSRKGKAGFSGRSVTPQLENGREQYAASSKSRNEKKAGNKTSVSEVHQFETQGQVAQNAGNTSQNENKSHNLKNSEKANNITHEFKNQDKIAVNENYQSGQTEQHNQKDVTAKTTTSTQAVAAKTDDIKMDSTALAMAEKPNALEELLNIEKENKQVTENEPKMNRWQVSPRVAPIYLSSSSNGSPIDSRFANNDKDYKTQLSYGLGVSYALNKRLSLRTGVNSLAFEYNTNNVVAKQSTVGRKQLEHVNPTVQGAFLRIENKVEGAPVELANNGMVLKEFSSSLSQKTGYFEIPVELSYKVLDKRFGIDVIGGFSTLLLNQNEVALVSAENQMQVGKANNLNATSFSTNVGVGFRYEIWKSLQLNFEPTFKYQINTYTESGNFKPYFFGLYTGLNYRF